MDTQNRLPRKYDPSTFQTMIDGAPVTLDQLSRDDLLQALCETMDSMEVLQVLQEAMSNTMARWVDGKPSESLEEIGKRFVQTD